MNGIFIKNSLTGERARERKVKMVNVIITNTKIKVESTYNAKFVRLAKTVQGRWEKPYWVFPIDNEERVREILMEVYGEDGRPCETVSVDLILDDYGHGDCIFFGDLLLANRPGRDVRVRLASNVMVAKGNFNASECELGLFANAKQLEKDMLHILDYPNAWFSKDDVTKLEYRYAGCYTLVGEAFSDAYAFEVRLNDEKEVTYKPAIFRMFFTTKGFTGGSRKKKAKIKCAEKLEEFKNIIGCDLPVVEVKKFN